MEIKLRCEGTDEAGELAEGLYQWLLDEADARRYADVSLVAVEPREGELGVVFDVVQLILNSGFSAASLGYTVAQWKKTNAPQVSVIFERDGKTVTVSGTSTEEVERAIQRLIEE